MKKKNNRGQALVEYVLIISLITVLEVVLIKYLGGYLKDAVTKMSCSISDKEYVEGNKPGEGKCVEEAGNLLD